MLVMAACSERQRPAYSRLLVQADSLLQRDSLKWKNLYRGEALRDCFIVDGKAYGDFLAREIKMPEMTADIPSGYITIKNGKMYLIEEYTLDFSQVEHGIHTQANNPLFLLKHFPQDSLHSEADSAYYALLFSEAQVKDYIARKGYSLDQKHAYLYTDSLIKAAVAYYDKHQDAPMQAKAHALMGFFHRMNPGGRAKAIREFHIASRYAEATGDKELLAFIYKFMAREYFYANTYSRADSIFSLVEQLATEQQDTMAWIKAIYYRLHILTKGNLTDVREQDSYIEQRALQGMELARAVGYKEMEAKLAVLLGHQYLNYYRETDSTRADKALRCALLADSLDAASTNELLAKAYIAKGDLDKAAPHLDEFYGKDWRKTGTRDMWTLSYTPETQGEVASIEEQLVNEWQKEHYENFLARYKHLITWIVIAGALLVVLMRLYYRRKYRRQSERLLQQQEKSSLLHSVLQEGLKQKEEEILRLQKELEERRADASSLPEHITEELEEANKNRAILAKETMEHSPAYNKVQLMIADFRWKDESDHRMTEADWQELVAGVNTCCNDVLARLTAQHSLSEREARICCLSLLDVPVVHIARLIGYTRPIIYKTERDILERMGEKYERGKLRTLLKTL